MEELTLALAESMKQLQIGGIIATVSFQALEDRIIKNFLKSSERSMRHQIYF